MKHKRIHFGTIAVLLTTVLLLSVSGGVLAAGDLSGSEILEKVDQKSEIVSQGEIMSVLTFNNVNADGTTSSYKFGALARKKKGEPDRTLVYYLQPEFVKGTIFLTKETEEGESRMWLYLSALGEPKELTASKKQSSFADSTLSFEEVSSWSMSEEYNAEIVEETTVQVGDQSVPVYKLQLTAKEDANPQYPTETIWVGKDNWVLLHTKNFNDTGELEKEMKVEELTTFEEKTVTKKLVTTVMDSGASTTVIYEKRERPDQDVPDSVFDPENLGDFDPDKWGLTE